MVTEGVGRVVAVASDVRHSKERRPDAAIVPDSSGRSAFKNRRAMVVGLAARDIKPFAMMGVNPPTAYVLLTSIVELRLDSWVIRDAANSGVGRVIGINQPRARGSLQSSTPYHRWSRRAPFRLSRATYRFDQVKEAATTAEQGGGKVLFRPRA
jgi:hypothetical protein